MTFGLGQGKRELKNIQGKQKIKHGVTVPNL